MPLNRLSIVAAAVTIVITPVLTAGKYNKVLKIGDQAPAWNELLGSDEKKHSLDDLKKAKAVVVVFTCNTCPVAVAYEKRLVAFAKAYKKKGVVLVAINSNRNGGNDPAAMATRAKERGFTFPYVADPEQKMKKLYGAQVTPEFFLLDGKRKIAYMGRLDNAQDESKVKNKDLVNAVEAVLAGKPPPVTETRPFGCGIK